MKINYLFPLLSLFLFASCQKETLKQEKSLGVDNCYLVEPVEASDEMLSFSSMDELNKTVESLLALDSVNLVAWYSQYPNFTSLNQLYNKANYEFAVLVNSNVRDVNIAERIKNKYTPYLLFNDNPNDNALYCPVIPSEFPGRPLISNKNGDVLVNGKVMNLNDVKSVQETSNYKESCLTRVYDVHTRRNWLFMQNSDRMMSARSYRYNAANLVYIEVVSKKDTWLGWVHYDTVFIIQAKGKWLDWDWNHAGMAKWVKTIVNDRSDTHYHRPSSQSSFLVGAVLLNPRGSLLISTNGTVSVGIAPHILEIYL